MPKRDFNQVAYDILQRITGEVPEAANPKKRAAGRAGGLKGGKTRMDALTPVQRTALGKKAAAKRWKKPAPRKGAG